MLCGVEELTRTPPLKLDCKRYADGKLLEKVSVLTKARQKNGSSRGIMTSQETSESRELESTPGHALLLPAIESFLGRES